MMACLMVRKVELCNFIYALICSFLQMSMNQIVSIIGLGYLL